MTYVVTEVCIKCKYTDCVEVCPVDCLYEGENMLVIHPDECIDCGVCEPECPVDAIKPDTGPNLDKWLDLNRQYWRAGRTLRPRRRPRRMPTHLWPNQTNSRSISAKIRAKATEINRLNGLPFAKMSHVAAPKRQSCRI